MIVETARPMEVKAGRGDDSTLVIAHELVCRADDRYRDGDFLAAARLYRQAADGFDAAARAASGSLDQHALESLQLLARSHRKKGARLEKMTGQSQHSEKTASSEGSGSNSRKSPHGRIPKGLGGSGMPLPKSASYIALEQSVLGPATQPPWSRFMHNCQKLLEDLTSAAGASAVSLLDDSVLEDTSSHGGRDGKLGGRAARIHSIHRRDRDEMMGSVCLVSSALVSPSPPSRSATLPSRPPAREDARPPDLSRMEGSRQTAIEENHPLLCTVEHDDTEERKRATAALTNPRGRHAPPDESAEGSPPRSADDQLKSMSRAQLEEAVRGLQQGVDEFAMGFAAEARTA
eukprot:CAMPEP_0196731930 /NCGR_PEP_ID=MMETSP1091-20130531/11464_1 /TAXON_ID=302021 /ORGANISM="Rhodomonas sp., Strain CCMP768" /LENGTH=346 /DNA_ID=CAMNT_0042075107 /DNA_START=82 /DNA_END=1118 /DNA_ORIENTATION=+